MFVATQIAIKRGTNVPKGGLSEMWWLFKPTPWNFTQDLQNFGLVQTLVTRPINDSFYDRLLETLQNNEIGRVLDKPHLTLNADESEIKLDSINKIVAAARGAKHVSRLSKGQHEKVTVMACAFAMGNSLPQMFIFKNMNGRVPYRVQEGAPAGSLSVAPKSGWIDKELYLK